MKPSYANNFYKVTLCNRKRKSGKIDPPWNDGDTVNLSFDLGQKVVIGPYDCRVNGIDAPETRLGRGTSEAEKRFGLKIKADLNERFPAGTVMWAKTTPDKSSGKYGRYLVDLYYDVIDHNEITGVDQRVFVHFNAELVKTGQAVDYGPGNWEGFGDDDLPKENKS